MGQALTGSVGICSKNKSVCVRVCVPACMCVCVHRYLTDARVRDLGCVPTSIANPVTSALPSLDLSLLTME